VVGAFVGGGINIKKKGGRSRVIPNGSRSCEKGKAQTQEGRKSVSLVRGERVKKEEKSMKTEKVLHLHNAPQ